MITNFLRLLLYPGIICHEFMHLFACIFLGVKVKKLKFGLKESFVEHANSDSFRIFIIGTAPFFFGNLIAFFLIIFALKRFISFFWLFALILWIAISIIFYSIPSSQDTKNISSSLMIKINKLFNQGFFGVLTGLLLFLVIYIPIYFFLLIFNLFERYEILRIILIYFIFMFAISFK